MLMRMFNSSSNGNKYRDLFQLILTQLDNSGCNFCNQEDKKGSVTKIQSKTIDRCLLYSLVIFIRPSVFSSMGLRNLARHNHQRIEFMRCFGDSVQQEEHLQESTHVPHRPGRWESGGQWLPSSHSTSKPNFALCSPARLDIFHALFSLARRSVSPRISNTPRTTTTSGKAWS